MLKNVHMLKISHCEDVSYSQINLQTYFRLSIFLVAETDTLILKCAGNREPGIASAI